MKHIVYLERNIDARVLTGDDLATVGVEGFEDTTFRQGVAIELNNKTADALLEHPEIFGRFEDVTEQEEARRAEEAAAAEAHAAREAAAQAEAEKEAKAAAKEAKAAEKAAQEAAAADDPATGSSQESTGTSANRSSTP